MARNITQRADPGEGEGFAPMPSKLWTPRQKQLVTGNYVRAYQNAPDVARQHGANFYPSWHEDAQHIGQAIGRDTNAGAALLAHLSPANEAEQNRIHALQVTHGVSDRQEKHLLKAGQSASMATGAASRRTHALKAGDTVAASRWDAEAQQHKADTARFRQLGGIKGTPLGGLGSREIANALKVRSGAHADALGSLGDVKIGDFGRLIADPTAKRAPIDTHYHDAGVNRIDIPYAQSRGLEAKGRYEHFQGAHEAARQQISRQTGVEVSTADLMGGIWYAHQQRKVEGNPSARKARLASETKLSRIRGSKSAQQFLPERFGLKPSFGKIAT